MKIKLSKLTIITTLLCLLPIILSTALYDKLPDVMVTHWGINNEPNGWSPKWMACFGIPFFMAVMNLIIGIATDNNRQQISTTSSVVVNICRWITPVLTLILMPIILYYSLGVEMNIEKIVCTIVGVLFVVLGNYLPKCRRNYIIGIKLPWTLKSEENWNKTHRFGGFVFMICGVLILVSSWAGTSRMTVAVLFAMIIIPTVYSYILHRRGV